MDILVGSIGYNFILASASARRLQLLRQIGIEPALLPVEVAELSQGLPPAELVLANALAKIKAALALSATEQAIIIAADTVVALDGQIFGKPATVTEAAAMLSQLSGRRHTVYTAVAIADSLARRVLSGVSATDVDFFSLSHAEIAAYIADGEPFDKAGAYGIQGRGALLVERIYGDYTTVVGLTLPLLRQLLLGLKRGSGDEI